MRDLRFCPYEASSHTRSSRPLYLLLETSTRADIPEATSPRQMLMVPDLAVLPHMYWHLVLWRLCMAVAPSQIKCGTPFWDTILSLCSQHHRYLILLFSLYTAGVRCGCELVTAGVSPQCWSLELRSPPTVPLRHSSELGTLHVSVLQSF